MIGKPDNAIPLSQRIIEVDPLMPVNYLAPTFMHWSRGQIDQALEACRNYYRMAPKNIHARLWFAIMLIWNGRLGEASDLVETNEKEYPGQTMTIIVSFFLHAVQNNKKKAVGVLTDDFLNYAWNESFYSWLLGESFALLNEKREALKWLKRTIDLGLCNYSLFNAMDPYLENIRGESEFKKLMERIKKEWEHFEV
jgi:hypothetical protein